jgi:hypothetical protein
MVEAGADGAFDEDGHERPDWGVVEPVRGGDDRVAYLVGGDGVLIPGDQSVFDLVQVRMGGGVHRGVLSCFEPEVIR